MTKRILGLLWRIALVPPTFSGLDMAPYFAEVLRDYAILNRSKDTRQLALAFVSQLWEELMHGDKAIAAMRVLDNLISAPSPQYVGPHCVPGFAMHVLAILLLMPRPLDVDCGDM